MTNFNVIDSRDLGLFIPSALDDFGLTPNQFRVYYHVARRVAEGFGDESIECASSICQMSIEDFIQADEDLDALGLFNLKKRNMES